ncbi:hypothetical protein GCM10017688_42080 [Streptomyces ramulosus]
MNSQVPTISFDLERNRRYVAMKCAKCRALAVVSRSVVKPQDNGRGRRRGVGAEARPPASARGGARRRNPTAASPREAPRRRAAPAGPPGSAPAPRLPGAGALTLLLYGPVRRRYETARRAARRYAALTPSPAGNAGSASR